MMGTTAPLADWDAEMIESRAVAAPAVFKPLAVATGEPTAPTVDEDHIERLTKGETTPPDPTARERMASALHRLTGWDFPEVSHDRAYVSRLWAEDWNSAEDAAYDE